MTELSGWDNFYVIVGSSAGALIGLQFVLISLIAHIPIEQSGEQAGNAFATPTIVHFGVVLLLAGITTAPWHDFTPVAMLWGALGFGGVAYIVIVQRRMRRQTAYRPEFEDWLFHALLPMVAYATLAMAALITHLHVRGALFGVGGAAMLLLFVGIHNAWDAATYHVFVVKPEQNRRS
jgi:hypothetical protein